MRTRKNTKPEAVASGPIAFVSLDKEAWYHRIIETGIKAIGQVWEKGLKL
jgi:hypothetical protein